MKVAIRSIVDKHACLVEREPGDRKIHIPKGRKAYTWGSAESLLLHKVKTILNSRGYDLIKKRMHKDGHMTSEEKQYLRQRNVKNLKPGDLYCIYDNEYDLRNSAEDYNNGEVVVFRVEYVELPSV